MLDLNDCKEQHQYRRRDLTETEPVRLLTTESEHSLLQLRLLSLKSKDTAKIKFHNHHEGHVRALWVDFGGHEVAYSILSPGESKLYMTYHNHCWIVRELVTGRRMNIDGSQVIFATKHCTQSVHIHAPPLLTWQEGRHLGFPEEFRLSTRALLFCHNNLSKLAPRDPCHLLTYYDSNRHIKRCKVCQLGDPTKCSHNTMCSGRQCSNVDNTAGCDSLQSIQQPPKMRLHFYATPSDLSSLPVHILRDIIQLSAPTNVWQDVGCLGGCPDILPALAPNELVGQVRHPTRPRHTNL